MQKTRLSNAKGFSLVEVLIVLGILSFLSAMMIVAITGARRIGTTAQAQSVAQQKNRYIHNIMERDIRLAGTGVYKEVFERNNSAEYKQDAGIGGSLPDQFNFSIDQKALDGLMLSPIEVVNGTDTPAMSYLFPLESTIGLTSSFREPGTDLITIYQRSNSGFSAIISGASASPDSVIVSKAHIGERMLQLFNRMGSRPILVSISDEEGLYSTIRMVTGIEQNAGDYNVFLSAPNSAQPEELETFLTSVKGGGVDVNTQLNEDNISQLNAVSYFVYTHPIPAMGARGWLVRLDHGAIVASGNAVNANNPETIRPYVISENVADFQVALGVDTDESGIIDAGEWQNSENMENSLHYTPGDDTATNEYEDFINNLRAVRYSVVSYTDETSANDRIGFADPDSSNFSAMYPNAAAVADFIGITPTLEDRVWDYNQLIQRLWYHRAVQVTKSAVIRNMDLENTFAREQ